MPHNNLSTTEGSQSQPSSATNRASATRRRRILRAVSLPPTQEPGGGDDSVAATHPASHLQGDDPKGGPDAYPGGVVGPSPPPSPSKSSSLPTSASRRQPIIEDEDPLGDYDFCEETPLQRMEDEEREDARKQLEELTDTFWGRYKPVLLLSGYSFMVAMADLDGPFLTQIKADQLGGDQEAAMTQSIIQCVFAIVGMFTAAIFGQLVDTFGRRPFFIVGSAALVTYTGMATFARDRILISMIAQGFASLIQASFISVWIADVYSSKMRIQAVAIATGIACLGALATIMALFFTQDTIFLIGFGFSCGAFVWSILFIPETMPALVGDSKAVFRRGGFFIGLQKRPTPQELLLMNSKKYDTEQRPPQGGHEDQEVYTPAFLLSNIKWENPLSTLKIFFQSKLLMSCFVISLLYELAQVGTGDVYMFYLGERISFTAQDNTYLIVESGLVVPVSLIILLPLGLRFFPPLLLVFFSLIMLILELVLIATIWAKWPVFVLGVPIVALTGFLPVVITGILQNSGNSRDQGKRLTGLQACIDLASAIGPLMFGLLFGKLTKSLVFLPFVICAGLAVPPMILTLRMNRWMKEEREAMRLAAEEASQQATITAPTS